MTEFSAKLNTYIFETEHRRGESLEPNNMAVAEAVFDIKHTFYSELLVNYMFNHSRSYKNTKYKHRWL